MPEFSTQTGGTYFEDEDIAWAYDAVSDTLNDDQRLACTYGIAACSDYAIQVSFTGCRSGEKPVSSQCGRRPPHGGCRPATGGRFWNPTIDRNAPGRFTAGEHLR